MEDKMADTEQYRPTVVILEQDLFFSVRLEDVVRAAGGDPITIEDADLFVAAVEPARRWRSWDAGRVRGLGLKLYSL